MALGDCQQGVVLRLIGAEAAGAPVLHVFFQGNGFIGAAGVAHRFALEVIEVVDAGVVAGQHYHLEGEVGHGEADGLGPFEGVGGGGDNHVGASGDQRRNAIRERRFHDFGFDAEDFCQVMAVVHVEPGRAVAAIAKTHGREVEGHGAAQFAGTDDVVEFVGLGGGDEGGA
ncbi:hypothetical protein D3C71_1524440 [compost metagenome]